MEQLFYLVYILVKGQLLLQGQLLPKMFRHMQ